MNLSAPNYKINHKNSNLTIQNCTTIFSIHIYNILALAYLLLLKVQLNNNVFYFQNSQRII